MKIFLVSSKREKVKIKVTNSGRVFLHIAEYKESPISVPITHTSSVHYFNFNNTFLSIFTGLVFAGLFSFGIYVFAVPPARPYIPGATLDPSCSPGTTNCTVNPPVYFTGSTLDIGSFNFSGGTPLKIKYNSNL